MNQSRTTLAQMSKALNLSVSTISKSLSDSSEISSFTKNRVKEFADQCNYVPNQFARSFRKGFSKTIGLIVPNILNPFYAKVMVGVENYLHKHGYKLITSISNESKDKEEKSLNSMTRGYVDGLIICSSKETELLNAYSHINSIIDTGTPLVMFDRISELINCDKVIINDYKTIYDITSHLVEVKNCKNMVLASLIDNLHHGKLRTQGFRDAIAANDSIKGNLVVAENSELLRLKLKNMFENDQSIDGIIAVSEYALLEAVAIKKELATKGNTDNITIAGFSNQNYIGHDSSVIIVNQNAEEIGLECAKLIIKRIKTSLREDFRTKTVAVNFS